jgi:dienelactone hydrolase
MSEQMIKVTAEDGHAFDVFRATPDGDVKGGLVVLQEFFGMTDQHSPPKIIAGVKENIPDAETYVYDAGLAFANDARPNFFVEDAAKLARQRSLEFLDRIHGA